MTQPEQLLDLESQQSLILSLYTNHLFGIHEDPADFVRLKSGRLSPHYLDIRPALSSYLARQAIANAMTQLAITASGGEEPDFKYVVGSPEAMTSFGASIADKLLIGLLQPRVDMAKTRGNKSPILGKFKPGQSVAAFDDVITDGETKIETIETLQSASLEVRHFFVVLDREEGGAAQVEDATGIVIKPALSLSGMVKTLQWNGMLSETQFNNVAEYLNEYGDPHAKTKIGS